MVSEQGQAEPRPVHRLFPVGFSIPVGVAGSGPVAGVVTSPPPPKAWDPQTGCPPAKPYALSLGLQDTVVSAMVPAAAGATRVLGGQLVPRDHGGSGWAAGQGCVAQSRQECRG